MATSLSRCARLEAMIPALDDVKGHILFRTLRCDAAIDVGRRPEDAVSVIPDRCSGAVMWQSVSETLPRIACKYWDDSQGETCVIRCAAA